jgi:hypothetical protein
MKKVAEVAMVILDAMLGKDTPSQADFVRQSRNPFIAW